MAWCVFCCCCHSFSSSELSLSPGVIVPECLELLQGIPLRPPLRFPIVKCDNTDSLQFAGLTISLTYEFPHQHTLYVSGVCFAHLQTGSSLPHLETHFSTKKVLKTELKTLSSFTGSNSSFCHSRNKSTLISKWWLLCRSLLPPLPQLPKLCQPPSILPTSQWYCNRILTLSVSVSFFFSCFLVFPSFILPSSPPFSFLPSFLFIKKKKHRPLKHCSECNHMAPCGILDLNLLQTRAALFLPKNGILDPIYPRNHGEKFALISYFFQNVNIHQSQTSTFHYTTHHLRTNGPDSQFRCQTFWSTVATNRRKSISRTWGPLVKCPKIPYDHAMWRHGLWVHTRLRDSLVH